MKIINLIYPEKSDVKVTISTFPDGEKHIVLDDIQRKSQYKVITRICNAEDLFILMQVNDILTRQEIEWDLCITYLMSMRMDRVIHFSEAFSLKVVTNIINGFSCQNVSVFHPHSSRTINLINNIVKTDFVEFNSNFVENIISTIGRNKYAIAYPDAGAYERYHTDKLTLDLHFIPTIAMKKERDLENQGKIKSIVITDINHEYELKSKEWILVEDDLCDAGGTFAWSAKILRERYPSKRLAIVVRHMVNEVGIKNLASTYDKVFITNSYKDWDVSEYPNVDVFDIVNEYSK